MSLTPTEKKQHTSGTIVRPLRVVCHEPDETSMSQISAALAGLHHLVRLPTHEAVVERLSDEARAPDVVLIALPPSRGDALALLTSLDALPGRPLVLGLAAQLDDGALDAFVRRTLDDVVVKPFDVSTLRIRIRLLGARTQVGAEFGPTARVLRGALAHRSTGEVIVRGQLGVARILVANGNVAWVHCPWQPIQIRQALWEAGATTADEADLLAIVAEARKTGSSLFSVIARWGITSPEALDRSVQSWINSTVDAVLADISAFAMFVPGNFDPVTAGPTVEGGDLVRRKLDSFHSVIPSSPPPCPEYVARAEEFASTILRACHAESMAIITLSTREVRWLGENVTSTDIVWGMLPLAPPGRPPGERREIWVTVDSLAYVLWSEPGSPVAVFGRFSLVRTSLGIILSVGRGSATKAVSKT